MMFLRKAVNLLNEPITSEKQNYGSILYDFVEGKKIITPENVNIGFSTV
jgi:hypothetical protein